MLLPSRTIFAKLYNPSADAVKQPIALSRGEAEALSLLESVTVIPITAADQSRLYVR